MWSSILEEVRQCYSNREVRSVTGNAMCRCQVLFCFLQCHLCCDSFCCVWTSGQTLAGPRRPVHKSHHIKWNLGVFGSIGPLQMCVWTLRLISGGHGIAKFWGVHCGPSSIISSHTILSKTTPNLHTNLTHVCEESHPILTQRFKHFSWPKKSDCPKSVLAQIGRISMPKLVATDTAFRIFSH